MQAILAQAEAAATKVEALTRQLALQTKARSATEAEAAKSQAEAHSIRLEVRKAAQAKLTIELKLSQAEQDLSSSKAELANLKAAVQTEVSADNKEETAHKRECEILRARLAEVVHAAQASEDKAQLAQQRLDEVETDSEMQSHKLKLELTERVNKVKADSVAQQNELKIECSNHVNLIEALHQKLKYAEEQQTASQHKPLNVRIGEVEDSLRQLAELWEQSKAAATLDDSATTDMEGSFTTVYNLASQLPGVFPPIMFSEAEFKSVCQKRDHLGSQLAAEKESCNAAENAVQAAEEAAQKATQKAKTSAEDAAQKAREELAQYQTKAKRKLAILVQERDQKAMDLAALVNRSTRDVALQTVADDDVLDSQVDWYAELTKERERNQELTLTIETLNKQKDAQHLAVQTLEARIVMDAFLVDEAVRNEKAAKAELRKIRSQC